MVKWKQNYHFLVFKNLWSDINKYVLPHKVKETHFKIINTILVMTLLVNLKKGFHHYAVSVGLMKKMKH